MKKTVSLLIPSRFDNRWNLELCLKSIRKYTKYPYKIIIGDAGIEGEAKDFLSRQKDIRIVKCPDPIRPKNYLARVINTSYFLFLHDDVQILRHGWLERRVKIMEQNPKIGIVGVLGNNYMKGLRKLLNFSPIYRRLFPLVMLVRKEMQDELDLFWGIVKGFDTGGVAYLQFIKQKKWRLKRYKFNADVTHWGQMTWTMKKRTPQEKKLLDFDKLAKERNQKVNLIKTIIEQDKF